MVKTLIRIFSAHILLLCVSSVFASETQLLPGDEASFNYFGNSAAISGDTAIIGGHGIDGANGADAGAAYVFVRNGNAWTQQAKLIPTGNPMGDPMGDASGDNFGFSVAISGNTAIVGAYGDEENGADAGAIYVFVYDAQTGWGQQAKLLASDGADGDKFGISVGILNDTIIVGAYGDDTKGADAGAAYIFARVGTAWTEKYKLLDSSGASGDSFGNSVAISNNRALVGAYGDADNGCNSGSAFAFTKITDTDWGLGIQILPALGSTQDYFGFSLSLSSDGNNALIGAPSDGNNPGAAYVFVHDGSVWNQQTTLTADYGSDDDQFGTSVSISNNIAVIGADHHQSLSGSAYVFVRNAQNVWSQQTRLTATNGDIGESFANAVSISGEVALIGAFRYTDAYSSSGSAYVYRGDADGDTDGVSDWLDNCPTDSNASQTNADGDGLGDACDAFDNDPTETLDTDGDGDGNNTDVDDDDDGLNDDVDPFPLNPNIDSDGDGLHDGIDDDDDNDGALDGADAFPLDPTEQLDTDGDGDGNNTDTDDDNDGTLDVDDDLPLDDTEQLDTDGDGIGNNADPDDDNDGMLDGVDPFPLDPTNQSDIDGDGIFDTDDADIDGDGIPNAIEELLLLNPLDNLDGALDLDLDSHTNASEYTAGTPLDDINEHPGLLSNPPFKFFTADGTAGDAAGISVAVDGDYAVIGAHQDDTNGENSGAAYIYQRVNDQDGDGRDEWEHRAKLLASDGAAGDYFGFSVAIAGDTVLIGAHRKDGFRPNGTDAPGAGKAYAFVRNGQAWTQSNAFTAQFATQAYDSDVDDNFGYSVAVSDSSSSANTIAVIGAKGVTGDGSFKDRNQGAVYVYAYVSIFGGPLTWYPIEKVIADDAAVSKHFGSSVAISDNSILVGAYGAGPDNLDPGSAYIFTVVGALVCDLVDCVVQESKLTAGDGVANNNFGISVDISGDTALVGADFTNITFDKDDVNLVVKEDRVISKTGAAYVFKRTSSWNQTAKLTIDGNANNYSYIDDSINAVADNYDYFGSSVALDGSNAIIGAPGNDAMGTSAGSAYLFVENTQGNWFQQAHIVSDIESTDFLGGNVAISGTNMLVGAWSDDDVAAGAGATYQYSVLADIDGDGISNDIDNCPTVSNTNQDDVDNDALGDACDLDNDNDGLSDIKEIEINTDPLDPDSDGDNLTDYDEIVTIGTKPTEPDTDFDGFDDDIEYTFGSDPLDANSIPADGDINQDGVVDVADVLLATRIANGSLTPTTAQSVHADVAPLINGVPNPDGVVNAADLTLIQQKALGLVIF